MSVRKAGIRAALTAALAALAIAAIPASAGAANECNGIPRCIPIAGPWVAVPAHGEVDYVLSCPGGGVVAGTDGQGSSLDVRGSFDGILGSPVAFGRTTHDQALFRAVSARHKSGYFKPFIGCIPSPSSVRNTINTLVTPVGPPLDYVAKTIKINPGFQRTIVLRCPAGESLVDSWSSTGFGTTRPPGPGLASAVAVRTKVVGKQVQLLVTASEALPSGLAAQVQVGVRCAA
jgi:hypothetical protein